MIGQILGDNSQLNSQCPQYEVTQILGKKAGRRTLLAKQLDTGELVVIKLLIFGSDFEWQNLKLFEREAETLKHLSHPAIPRYLDYFEIKSSTLNGFALVQTYIPAQSLEQYIKSQRTFTEAEVKEIAKKVLGILVYLHQQNPPVIHRDIKPSNILLGDRTGNSVGKVYLVDFGAVQNVAATEGGTMTIVGTYGYMPQEQFGGRAVPASDLYSLGATLIYLATGTHPAELPQKDFRIQFQQIANLSPDFTNWLNSLIEPNLDNRLQSAKEALTSLETPQNLSANSQLTFSKPNYSKIKIFKTEDCFKVIIPKPSFLALISNFIILTIYLFFSILVFGIGLSYLLICILSIVIPVSYPSDTQIIAFFLSSPLFILSLITPLQELIVNLFGSPVEFLIDKKTIACQINLVNFRYFYLKPSRKNKITFITYKGKHYVIDEGKVVRIEAQLKIYIDDQPFSLPHVDSEEELQWLAHELSNWLGIPITEPKFKNETTK